MEHWLKMGEFTFLKRSLENVSNTDISSAFTARETAIVLQIGCMHFSEKTR